MWVSRPEHLSRRCPSSLLYLDFLREVRGKKTTTVVRYRLQNPEFHTNLRRRRRRIKKPCLPSTKLPRVYYQTPHTEMTWSHMTWSHMTWIDGAGSTSPRPRHDAPSYVRVQKANRLSVFDSSQLSPGRRSSAVLLPISSASPTQEEVGGLRGAEPCVAPPSLQ